MPKEHRGASMRGTLGAPRQVYFLRYFLPFTMTAIHDDETLVVGIYLLAAQVVRCTLALGEGWGEVLNACGIGLDDGFLVLVDDYVGEVCPKGDGRR